MSALEKAPNQIAQVSETAEQAVIFLESYAVTTDMVAIQGIQAMLSRYHQQYGEIRQLPGKMADNLPVTIEVWASS